MGAAAAEIVLQRQANLSLGRMRVAGQEGFGGHDHAVEAVAALRGLGLDERALHLAFPEPFERGDRAAGDGADGDHAGARGTAIDQHHAGAAFAKAAAEFRAVQREIVAQYVDQRRIGRRRHGMRPAIHDDRATLIPSRPQNILSDPGRGARRIVRLTSGALAPQATSKAGLDTLAGRMGSFVYKQTTRPLMSDGADKIRCMACPVLCFIRNGMTGACDRYANHDGALVRVDPHILLQRTLDHEGAVVPFAARGEWHGELIAGDGPFVTAIGAGTTYPDYKPAPFIISAEVDGVDMVTVVTEGIFSYCGVKVKIDTDRHLGGECAVVRADGEPVGHVTTGEYGSQMLSLGGVNHLTHGSKAEGRATCAALLDLCNQKPVELAIDGGARVIVQSGRAPVVNGVREERMRVGCGSASIGMFARQWLGLADEVVVVDDHITGVLSEHQAGKLLGVPQTGIRVGGRRSTPGRYFNVAEPGTGWGGTNLSDPLQIIGGFDKAKAWPGLRLFMVSTTGENAAYYELDDDLRPTACEMPRPLRESADLVKENCEPALCAVLFMGGAGGSLRAGATQNPVRLTQSVRDCLTRVTCGGAPVFIWPGGGITFMVDVSLLPDGAFGYVPTPALVAPIEFSMRLEDYRAMGGHMSQVRAIESLGPEHRQVLAAQKRNPWPLLPQGGGT